MLINSSFYANKFIDILNTLQCKLEIGNRLSIRKDKKDENNKSKMKKSLCCDIKFNAIKQSKMELNVKN